MKEKAYCGLTGFIFLVVCALHWTRVALRLPVHVGPMEFPVWLSVGGGVVSLLLSVWGFRLAARRQA